MVHGASLRLPTFVLVALTVRSQFRIFDFRLNTRSRGVFRKMLAQSLRYPQSPCICSTTPRTKARHRRPCRSLAVHQAPISREGRISVAHKGGRSRAGKHTQKVYSRCVILRTKFQRHSSRRWSTIAGGPRRPPRHLPVDEFFKVHVPPTFRVHKVPVVHDTPLTTFPAGPPRRSLTIHAASLEVKEMRIFGQRKKSSERGEYGVVG